MVVPPSMMAVAQKAATCRHACFESVTRRITCHLTTSRLALERAGPHAGPGQGSCLRRGVACR